jgi:hypothetical protein
LYLNIQDIYTDAQHFNKALQENMENRVPQAEEPVAASGLKSDEPKSTETDHPN